MVSSQMKMDGVDLGTTAGKMASQTHGMAKTAYGDASYCLQL